MLSFIIFSILLLPVSLKTIYNKNFSKLRSDWIQHKKNYSLLFNPSEDEKRFSIYLKNLETIEKINKMNLSYFCGMNAFGHMTYEEFTRKFLVESYRTNYNERAHIAENDYIIEPIQLDYRDSGIVSKVKNQGNCGSCWAFSAIGQIESQYAIMRHENITLSEQDLVDCSIGYGNDGCKGGYVNNAFDYMEDHGVNTNESYMYAGKDQQCKHDSKNVPIKVVKQFRVKPKNERALEAALLRVGPISSSIHVLGEGFRFYSGGIYVSTKCSNENLNHAILVVGFKSSPQGYFLIKNSWGESWGDKGFIYMGREIYNMCGIATRAKYAKIHIQ